MKENCYQPVGGGPDFQSWIAPHWPSILGKLPIPCGFLILICKTKVSNHAISMISSHSNFLEFVAESRAEDSSRDFEFNVDVTTCDCLLVQNNVQTINPKLYDERTFKEHLHCKLFFLLYGAYCIKIYSKIKI